MADNNVDVFFKKGTPLPAKASNDHKTVKALRKNDMQGEIRVPFVEGEHDEADLNRKIGDLVIKGSQLTRDVPIGSDVEIRVWVDASRLLQATVDIPILNLDRPFDVEFDLVKLTPSVSDLKSEFHKQQEHLAAVEESEQVVNNERASATLTALRREDAISTIENLLAAGNDGDSRRTCEQRLLSLKAALRDIERAATIPKLQEEAKNEIAWTKELIEENATDEERRMFTLLLPDVEAAMSGEADVLRRKIDELYRLRLRMLDRKPEFWVHRRDLLLQRKAEMIDRAQAELWFAHAERAIGSGDLEALKSACNQLLSLLPKQQQTQGYGGSTVRARRTSV